jgi:Trp operon repressor
VNEADDQEAEAPLITLCLSVEEGRWLVTAVGIAQRLLEGLHLRGREAQRYQIRGLAALHRIANQLPSGLVGYYPTSDAFRAAESNCQPADTAEDAP